MSLNTHVLALIVACSTVLASEPAAAQQTESRIVGSVTDQNGGMLPGVSVTVTSKSTGAMRTVVSDEMGRYVVTNLGPGVYEVSIELTGFAPNRQEVALGVGGIRPVGIALEIAGLSESVTVAADVSVVDTTSARIGVNVSPEEIANLPVNGRNFANLMTLATGATTDGNGGWASVRFNGKSNQQNYLNYDGVDGTYVWDASPGYLAATGSQFRLQTSMESIAEFRVNSGLAPAESGLGAGGNITVVSKSGTNRLSGSLFEYLRSDAMDSASKYDDKKQELEMNQFGASLGGPLLTKKTFFFASYEGLKQTTGISFTEAVPGDEAIRRIMAGEPVGTGSGQSAARTQAVAPLLAGFPRGTVATSNLLLALATLETEANQKEHSAAFRLDQRFTNSQMSYLRLLYSNGDVNTPDRTVTRRRVRARQQPLNAVFNHQSIAGGRFINEVKVGFNRPQYSAVAFADAPGYDPAQVSLSGTVTSQSIRHQSSGHPAHVQRLGRLSAAVQRRAGRRLGAIVNARSGVPINVTINRPDTKSIDGVTVLNIPGGNSRGTQRPDLVPGVNPYLKDGVRWLNPAAFTTPQPGTFGNLGRNALRGPGFWQVDLMASKDFRFGSNQGIQIRAEMFNLLNHLNYENPAAVLPDGTAGVPFTDAQAGTFGYMLGPLNRTVGLGTARQTQVSVRFLF
jgi:hypothetical protein